MKFLTRPTYCFSTAFLTMEDVNVIVVDWSDLASSFYTTAAAGVPSVGEYLGNFLVWLLDLTGGSWDDMHMVGHSLGAHVVGNAGRVVNGSVARITGEWICCQRGGLMFHVLTIEQGRVNTDFTVINTHLDMFIVLFKLHHLRLFYFIV